MKRTRQHVMEEESERIFRDSIPAEWIVRNIPTDYGIDLEVEIVEQEIVTGKRFWIQLKSSESCEIKKDSTGKAYISHSAKTNLLEYALSCDFPLLLVLVDLKTKMVYWLPLQDEIIFNLQKRSHTWREQKNNVIYIPQNNNLKNDSTLTGFQWYSLEPARMRAFAMIHHYYHELQHETYFNYIELDDGYIENEEKIIKSCEIARDYLTLALEQNVIFGTKGILLNISLVKPMIKDGIQSCDNTLQDIANGEVKLQETSIDIDKISHAINLLSTTISMYQEDRKKFLFLKS